MDVDSDQPPVPVVKVDPELERRIAELVEGDSPKPAGLEVYPELPDLLNLVTEKDGPTNENSLRKTSIVLQYCTRNFLRSRHKTC